MSILLINRYLTDSLPLCSLSLTLFQLTVKACPRKQQRPSYRVEMFVHPLSIYKSVKTDGYSCATLRIQNT